MSLFLSLVFVGVVLGIKDRPSEEEAEKYGKIYKTISVEYDISEATECKTNADCSYNGDCKNDICVCYTQWMGPHCGVLHLLPTNKTYGYQYILNDYRVSSWGGPVLRADDGMYHMWNAEMSEYCGINAWQPNSIVVHSISSTPNSGISSYIRAEEIDDIFSHEPDVIRGPNGEYVMYYSHVYPPPTGTADIDPCTDCFDGITMDCTEQMSHFHPYIIFTYMIWATDPNGPWSNPQVIPSDISIDSNLAGYIYPNGSFIGIFRGYGDIQGMRASNWKDNSTYSMYSVTLDPPNQGEDPFMWMDSNNILHTIWHAGGWDAPYGYHRFSDDNGITWTGYDYSIQTYNNTVYFMDGDIVHYQRMERPHLVFDKDGFTPIALTNGCEMASFNQVFFPDYSYTMLRPIFQG